MIQKNEGQSTIEFLMSFIFVIGFMMTFVRISMNYTNGYLVHYATYVSSRAFMVADNNGQGGDADNYATLKARRVYERFNFAAFINDFDSQLRVNTPAVMDDSQTNLYVGVYVDYRDFFSTPNLGPAEPLDLRSESYLGREPTRVECYQRICDMIRQINGDCQFHATVVDNGC
ncbi:hypothetical protein OAT67_00075 [Bacteriovoracaceae bacterium]|nr:hypothetical protein [Bacteriovoracaceae bacterium]